MSHTFINLEGAYILEISDGIFIDATPVAEFERERIIKLLETEPLENPRNYSDEDIWAFQVAIALIKGEK